MICSNCGCLNSDGAKHCVNCGNSLVLVKNKKNKKWGIIIVPLVIFFIWFLMYQNDNQPMDKVNNDIQLCKTVKTALEIANKEYEEQYGYPCFDSGRKDKLSHYTQGMWGTYNGIHMDYDFFIESFKETAGMYPAEVKNKIKTNQGQEEGDLEFYWVSDQSVVVYINNTDRHASGEKYKVSSTDCKCIYAGPVELLPEWYHGID